MLPDGWEQYSLGDILDFRNGFNTEKANYGQGTPFINVSEILKHESLTADLIPGQVKVTEREQAANSVVRGDILFNRTSETIDETGLTSVYLDTIPVIFGGFVIRGRPTNKALYPEFAKYAMRQPSVRREIIRRSQGVVRSNIGQGELSKVEILLPPLSEQRKIADILLTWDMAIKNTKALLATAKTQKRALMQTLLTGNRRISRFNDLPWKDVRLGEMGTTVSGGTPDSSISAYWNGDIDWATPTDITKLTSRFIRGTARRITPEGLKKSSAKLVGTGALLICTRATIGDLAIATGPVCTNQGFKNLVLSDDYDPDFVFYLLQFFRNELIRYACGSTFLELSKKDFDKRSFKVPGLVEQQSIAAVLNCAEDQVAEHARSVTRLRTEKKALMQQLLTGRRRVAVFPA